MGLEHIAVAFTAAALLIISIHTSKRIMPTSNVSSQVSDMYVCTNILRVTERRSVMAPPMSSLLLTPLPSISWLIAGALVFVPFALKLIVNLTRHAATPFP